MSGSVEFDEDVVLAKASTVRACLATIRDLESPGRADLETWMRRDLETLNIQRAAQACLDLAHHLIAVNGWELPRDAGHAMSILARHDVVGRGLEGRMRAVQGFRNVAVHRYTEIDVEILAAIVARHLDDLEKFTAAVVAVTVGAARQ